MNPMMDIDSKLHNFSSIKLYNPNLFFRDLKTAKASVRE